MDAVIFIGIPGTGKSTFFQQHFQNTHVRINLDMLKTRYREKLLLDACLAGKQNFVIDNTNVTAADRARYIPAARAAGFRVTGYYFQSQLDSALLRNQQRSGAAVVPAKAVRAKRRLLQPPRFEEGFDALYYVKIDPATSRFIVEEWKDS
jgi:predicted kinase